MSALGPKLTFTQNAAAELIRRRVSWQWKCGLGPVKDDLGLHRHRVACARGRGDREEQKNVAQSTRVCLIEPVGRGNSEAIASRSLFAVDLGPGAFQYRDGAYEAENRGTAPFACRIFARELRESTRP